MVSIKFGEVTITNLGNANAITCNGVAKGYNVYSTVLLSLVYPHIRVARVESIYNIDIHPDVIVYDIGDVCDPNNNRFDYNPYGDVSIRKKSFMLLWEKFGKQLLANIGVSEQYIQEVFECFKFDFVDSIDQDFSVFCSETESTTIINDFNPEWFDKFSYDEAYLRALECAKEVMTNALRQTIYRITQSEIQEDCCDFRDEILGLFDNQGAGNVIISDLEYANAITHNGTFYGIDVYSTALLSFVLPQVRVARIEVWRSIPRHHNAIVYDIGGVYDPEKNLYDHRDPKSRDYHWTTRKKTFGLLWKRYGREILTRMNLDPKYIEGVYESIHSKLVDHVDNNEIQPGKYCSYRKMSAATEIFDFNPVGESDDISSNEAFLKAVNHARSVLQNAIRQAIGFATGKDAVEKVIDKAKDGISDPGFFFGLQWEVHSQSRNPKRDEIYFIVFPYVTGDWWVETTRAAWDKHIGFPKNWEGKRGDDLVKITEVADATYCDYMGHHCRANSHEGALQLAKLAMQAINAG